MTPAQNDHLDARARPAAKFRIGMLVTQRETIETDLWRIVDLEGKLARLKPISLGATELQSPVGDLRRYQIKSTDQVFHDEHLVVVRRVLNPRRDDLYIYEVETEQGIVEEVREIDLAVHVGSEAPDPVEQLAALDAAPADIALARSELLHAYFEATLCSLGIVGYNGARMLPIPHQISAARYALQFGRPRFLLADEVGLGKTVEAGLIVSTLRKYFPQWRAAFFVPESLTVQWAFEMYGKFGKAIYRLEDDEELDEGEDDPGVILPHGRAAQWAADKRPGGGRNRPELLVVDEAHQVLRDPACYDALVELSRGAHAVLLLTATPSSDDGANLFKLLRLADPEAFESLPGPGALSEMIERQPRIEALLRGLADGGGDPKSLREKWNALGIEDQAIAGGMLALVAGGDSPNARRRIAAALADRHLPAARILRYQRKFLAIHNEMAERVEEPIEFRPGADEKAVRDLLEDFLAKLSEAEAFDDPDWIASTQVLAQAVFSSPLAVDAWLDARSGADRRGEGVTADPTRTLAHHIAAPEPVPGEAEWTEAIRAANRKWLAASKSADVKARDLARLGRYGALLKELQARLADEDDPQRFLVFTSFEANVRPLYLLLNRALGKKVEVFMLSAELSWREREKNAFAFQECEGPCVLVSDDLGGEGRNFQFANGLVHFDLPLAPWRVEQRIGRLDRVGRDPELDVDSLVLVAPGLLDDTAYTFLRDGIGVFNESIAPVEDMIEEECRRFLESIAAGDDDATEALIDRVRDELDERREREVEMLSARRDTGVEDVKRLAGQLDDTRELARLAKATSRYTRLLGSVVDDSGGLHTITVGAHHPLYAMPGILREMQGYFDRAEAVRHERLEFFSAGHPFVRTLARQAMQDSGDRVALAARPGLSAPAIVFSARVRLPHAFIESVQDLDEDLQPPILCAAGYHFATRMARLAVRLDGSLVADGDPDRALLLAPFERGRDQSLDEGPDIFAVLPDGWAEVCANAAQVVLDRMRADADAYLGERLPDLEKVLYEVFTRRFGLDKPVEAAIDALLFELEPLEVELDSAAAFFPPQQD